MVAHPIPSFDDIWSRCHVVSIPLRTPFRGLHFRESLIIDGPEGPGEWAAFSEYDDEEATWWLATALEQAFLPDLFTLGSLSPAVAVNAIVPAIPAENVEAWLQRFPGVTTAKVKVAEAGQGSSHDIARVAEVQRALGESGRIRIDANGAWSVDEALDMAEALWDFSIDYFEQPVAALDHMRKLKAPLADWGIRLAADELLRKNHQIDTLLTGEVCDVVIVKPSPLGGNRRSWDFARKAIGAGLEVVVSSGLETSVGLAYASRLAARLNGETGTDTAHGLATDVLFEDNVVNNSLAVTKGQVSTALPTLDPETLSLLAPSPERVQWWRSRLERCLPVARELVI